MPIVCNAMSRFSCLCRSFRLGVTDCVQLLSDKLSLESVLVAADKFHVIQVGRTDVESPYVVHIDRVIRTTTILPDESVTNVDCVRVH
jgi:hypothetical protein